MTKEEAIKVLEDEHRIMDPKDFDRCAKINLALDIAVRALRKELYQEKKKKKKAKKAKKKEYPCKHCEYGTYMTVEDMWWCSRYLMYAKQVARSSEYAKCWKGVANDKNRTDLS